jgi:transposase
MHVADHLSRDELRQRADAEPDKRRFVRIRAILLAVEGHTADQIAAALGYARRTIQGWIARYNAEGPDAFADRPRPGQPSHLPAALVDRLRERLDAGATPQDGVCTLRAKPIQAILEAEFGVLYSLSGVYALLHRLGYSCLEPRPRHRQADPAAREQFKKKSPTRSRQSPASTPRSGWRFGSRMRPASASRGH